MASFNTIDTMAAQKANIPGASRVSPLAQLAIFKEPLTMMLMATAIKATPMRVKAKVSYLPCP